MGILIVTCRTGHESICEEEIGNVLYEKDPGVTVRKTGYRDLLIVETSLPVEKMYQLVLSKEYAFVENVVPAELVIDLGEGVDKIVSMTEKLVGTDCYKIRVRSRGVRSISSEIYNRLVSRLGGRNCSGEKCLFIEIIGEKTYIGRGLCKPFLKPCSDYGEERV